MSARSSLVEFSTRGGLILRVGYGQEAIRLLDARWDALLHRQRFPNPTLASRWLQARAASRRGSPLTIVAEYHDRLVAGGAFEITRLAGFRIATWMGGNGRPSILPDIILDDDANWAGAAIFDRLLREDAHCVCLQPTWLDGPSARSLKEVDAWHMHRKAIDAWVVELPPPGHEKMQKKVAYRIRHAQRLGVHVDICIHEDAVAVQSALERLFELHSLRWKRRHDISGFSHPEAARAWYRTAVSAMAAHGCVRIVEVLESGELVASVLGLLIGSGSVFHTTATRTGGRLRGPGHLAMLAWVNSAMAAGAVSMHLGRGSCEPQSPKCALMPMKLASGLILGGGTSRTTLLSHPDIVAHCP